MKILDFYWSSNTDWWEWNPNGMSNKARCPKGRHKRDYKHYLEQICLRIGKSL